MIPEKLEDTTQEGETNDTNENADGDGDENEDGEGDEEEDFSFLNDLEGEETDASVAAAMAAISAWTPGSELATATTTTKSSSSNTNMNNEFTSAESELAAAMSAIAEGRQRDGLSANSSGGRPIDAVMEEYLNGTEEDRVDTQLLLALLEHICSQTGAKGNNAGSMNTTFERDGQTCLGGILVFLPGWGDISSLMEMMSMHSEFQNANRYKVVPLHGGIASSAQRQVFKRVPPNCRKIVLATNIAETSITIDDIVIVIDSGKYKSKAYDPYTQMSSLQTVWVPKSSAKQRAGRAGRVRPGICFTIMSKKRHSSCEDFATPELLRTPLEELCLQIKLLIHETPELSEGKGT